MANVYNVSIEPIKNRMPFGNKRNVYVLTDTLQNAMAIGKTKCANGEEVTGIYLDSEDVIIDHQAIGTQQI